MTARHDVVFLLEVDNTLLDNNRVIADLQSHLERERRIGDLLDADIRSLFSHQEKR